MARKSGMEGAKNAGSRKGDSAQYPLVVWRDWGLGGWSELHPQLPGRLIRAEAGLKGEVSDATPLVLVTSLPIELIAGRVLEGGPKRHPVVDRIPGSGQTE